jgi:hypothetical protein
MGETVMAYNPTADPAFRVRTLEHYRQNAATATKYLNMPGGYAKATFELDRIKMHALMGMVRLAEIFPGLNPMGYDHGFLSYCPYLHWRRPPAVVRLILAGARAGERPPYNKSEIVDAVWQRYGTGRYANE